MTIRKAKLADIPRMMEIFAIARKFMAETGNPNQWAPNYPSAELLTDDINSGDSYICMEEGRVVATFVLRGGSDPTYTIIYGGAWKNNDPYATIHRIASSGEVKGIFRMALDFALQHYSNIRIDTHPHNKVMQQAILKAGFQYCGIIRCWSGDERLAYQRTIKNSAKESVPPVQINSAKQKYPVKNSTRIIESIDKVVNI